MILLLLGTEQLPFKRAVDRVLPLAADEDLVVQHGHTEPREDVPRVTWIQFMPYERVLELCREASAVVCHAGVGAIMTARSVGKTPVVIPRLVRFGEHVDDHQLQITSELARHNLVVHLREDGDVRRALRLAAAEYKKREPSDSLRYAVANAADGQAAAHPRRARTWRRQPARTSQPSFQAEPTRSPSGNRACRSRAYRHLLDTGLSQRDPP